MIVNTSDGKLRLTKTELKLLTNAGKIVRAIAKHGYDESETAAEAAESMEELLRRLAGEPAVTAPY